MTAILTAAGCTLDDVVKTNCYLKDMNDFAVHFDLRGQRVKFITVIVIVKL